MGENWTKGSPLRYKIKAEIISTFLGQGEQYWHAQWELEEWTCEGLKGKDCPLNYWKKKSPETEKDKDRKEIEFIATENRPAVEFQHVYQYWPDSVLLWLY